MHDQDSAPGVGAAFGWIGFDWIEWIERLEVAKVCCVYSV
jgi:hypothetical protein